MRENERDFHRFQKKGADFSFCEKIFLHMSSPSTLYMLLISTFQAFLLEKCLFF